MVGPGLPVWFTSTLRPLVTGRVKPATAGGPFGVLAKRMEAGAGSSIYAQFEACRARPAYRKMWDAREKEMVAYQLVRMMGRASAANILGITVRELDKLVEGVQKETNDRTFQARQEISLATTGTHDTETMREWWEKAPQWERDAVARTWPELQGQPTGPEYSPPLHEALLRAALQSSSELCILPWQDVFAERDRVNLPGTVGPSNWSYRMKVRCEELVHREDTARAALWLKQLTQDGGRL